MESTGTVGEDQGLYLYCFFQGPSSLPPEKGIDGEHPTFVLSYRDLGALVSPVPLDEYNEEVLNQRLNDLRWLTPKVKRHEELIRSVRETCPVIPVKFGTLYTRTERVMELLRDRCEELGSFLEFVRDKEEWGVKVYVDEEAYRQRVEGKSDLVREFDQKLSSTTSGAAYFLKKKRDGLVQQEVLRLLDHLSGEIYQQIAPCSVEGRRNKWLSKEATGRKEEMILNAAFLLKRPELELFQRKIDEIAACDESSALFFEVSGPWPPYNFCPAFGAAKGAQGL